MRAWLFPVAVFGLAAIGSALSPSGAPTRASGDAADAAASGAPRADAHRAGAPSARTAGASDALHPTAGGVTQVGLRWSEPPPVVHLDDPGVPYGEIATFVASGDWGRANPAVTAPDCSPSPCVFTVSWQTTTADGAAFHDALLTRLYELGEGVGQPTMVLDERDDGTTRAWAWYVPDAAEPEVVEALAAQANARIIAEGGPVL